MGVFHPSPLISSIPQCVCVLYITVCDYYYVNFIFYDVQAGDDHDWYYLMYLPTSFDHLSWYLIWRSLCLRPDFSFSFPYLIYIIRIFIYLNSHSTSRKKKHQIKYCLFLTDNSTKKKPSQFSYLCSHSLARKSLLLEALSQEGRNWMYCYGWNEV